MLTSKRVFFETLTLGVGFFSVGTLLLYLFEKSL